MIEPQNTMMPIAEPRPVDSPQAEGDGFGAMLAASLGMVPQLDPSAVQQIATGNQQQQQSETGDEQPPAELAVEGSDDPAPTIGRPVTPTPGPNPPTDGRPRTGFATDWRSAPVDEKADHLRLPIRVAPPSFPEPPAADAAPQIVRPIDTIWKPALDAVDLAEVTRTTPPQPAVPPQEGPWPVDPGWKPAPVDQPVIPPRIPETPTAGMPAATESLGEFPPADQSDPGTVSGVAQQEPVVAKDPVAPTTPQPLPVDPAGPQLDPIEPRSGTVAPAVAAPVDLGVDRGPRLPTLPPDAVRPVIEPKATPEVAASGRVDLGTEPAVGLRTARSVVPVTTGPVVAEPAAAEVSSLFTATLGEAAAPAAFTAPTAEAPATLTSTLAERVMRAVDLQRTQPPPRSMVVDIPEVEGLRLIVSVRSAGQVSVTPASSSANPDAFTPFADDLSRVLAARGFVMTGDGRRRGHNNPYLADEPAPEIGRRPQVRRPSDNDLRI